MSRRIHMGVASLVMVLVAPLRAQQFTITDLGTLGGSTSFANGVSHSGIVAGDAKLPSGVKHAVLWDTGGIVDLGTPDEFAAASAVAVNDARQVAATGEGNPQSYGAYLWESGVWTPLGVLPGRSEAIAAAIDAAGNIVGFSFTLGAGDGRGFLWNGSALVDLGTLGGATRAEGMNDVGQVVGYSFASLPEGGQASRAFLWEDSVMTDLGVLAGETASWAFDVNDQGDVVGSSWHTTTQFLSAHRATLWRAGGAEVIDLGRTPGPEVCIFGVPYYSINIARAINNSGQVVGDAMCVGSGASLAAFLWQDSVMVNLNDMIPQGTGWNLLSALDINDDGEIVGVGTAPGGDLHGFLLTPVPTSVRTTHPVAVALRVFPNPFRGDTRISYTLPAPARVRLSVYDVAGRRIATVFDGVRDEGPHTLTWSASSQWGVTVPSGVYLLRLEGNGWVETRKVTVLE